MPRRRLSGECAPDEVRCRRTDGRRWRCSDRAMPGFTFCQHHLHLLQRNQAKIKSPPPTPPPPPPPQPPAKRRRREKTQKEEELMTPAKIRRVKKSPVPDHLRCRRADGRKWRCSERSMPGVSFCEYHYERARLNQVKVKSSVDPTVRKRRRKEETAAEKRGEKERKMTSAAAGMTRELPNGMMTISSPAKARSDPIQEAGSVSPLDRKLGFEPVLRRCIRSKNVEPLPVGTITKFPRGRGAGKRTCHRCGESKTGRIVLCSSCRKESFCSKCIKKWYSDMSKMEIKMLCPACRGCCKCKTCLLSEEKDAVCKEVENSQAKLIRIKYADYFFYQLLPVLKKINQEQIDELEIEAKRQGTKLSGVRVKVAENGRRELLYCNYCKKVVLDFLRSCSKCSYKLCLSCCQRIRGGNMLDKVDIKSSKHCDEKKPYKHAGTVLNRMRQKLSTALVPDNSFLSPSLMLPEWKAKNSENIFCPPKEFGGCGACLLSLIYLFPDGWSEELNIGMEQRALCYNYPERIDGSFHCSSQIDNNDRYGQCTISPQEALAK
ncbi:E3 ubiquitin-protein ligase JMJ24-like isoform X1 [Typha latifolia]|uniref:E3 ubiquitin-protein ligase JMJ24-like isoform X1 n=1 Tax=Typha latifolia TaxID=4733 RepID=UPI003C2C1CC6